MTPSKTTRGLTDAIPEFSDLDRQITRAIDRMYEAKQDCWAYRWADLAHRLMEAKRNTPTRDRESGMGAAPVAYRGVATSSKQSTTPVVVMEQTT